MTHLSRNFRIARIPSMSIGELSTLQSRSRETASLAQGLRCLRLAYYALVRKSNTRQSSCPLPRYIETRWRWVADFFRTTMQHQQRQCHKSSAVLLHRDSLMCGGDQHLLSLWTSGVAHHSQVFERPWSAGVVGRTLKRRFSAGIRHGRAVGLAKLA